MTPRILIIAGSDSGGGAGIQADIKTVTMLGGHAMTAITAITAQNTLGVQAVMPVPAEMVVAQARACADDIGVDAVKIGMIGSAETAHAVADWLAALDPARPIPIVFDPVMVATSGAVLADADTIAAFGRLMDLCTVVTPNLPELAALGGEAAVLARAPALLVKGGHGDGAMLVDRLVTHAAPASIHAGAQWESERIESTATHGTGCTLASALAVNLARGKPLKAAIARARQFVRLAIKDAPGLGQGHGPMGQQQVRQDLGPGPRLNQVTLPSAGAATDLAFYEALGLRQVVATDHGYARFEAPGGTTLSLEAGARPTIFLEVEDLDSQLVRLRRLGIDVAEVPTDQPWRWREARLTDPSGNAVCLFAADENRRYPPWRIA
ncbi:bifunctional hydroxymethylpyrimidine kinase/phosphomethylpyrimidine kinase [Sphingomonas sp.]|uniref:bifunctional hydroxymethylpyrimidine kinase/phosphomethylpyrimidine kinase n=1 Tax=Sphingomonas sp. TaxID=28214 RepID=UPI003AFF8A0E